MVGDEVVGHKKAQKATKPGGLDLLDLFYFLCLLPFVSSQMGSRLGVKMS